MTDPNRFLPLFRPLQAGGLKLRNRFMRSATWLAGADPRTGTLTEGLLGRYAELAAGGVGLVVTGYGYISRDGKSAPRQWALDGDGAVGDVRRIADVVHGGGAKVMVQIVHGGGWRHPSAVGAGRLLSPSGGALDRKAALSERLTEADIDQVIADFAAAAARVREGGADAVQIHGAHGFLLTQFLSPLHNRRDDGWGRSFEGRSKLFFSVYDAVRSAVGKDFPLWFKLSLSEEVDGGYGPEEGLRLALRLAEAGVDGIEVSGGAGYSTAERAACRIGVTRGESEAYFAESARALRAQAPERCAVALVGGLRSLEKMTELLEGGICDLFAMSRPFIAEPDLVNRWFEEDLVPSGCVSCNACFKTAEKGLIDCPVMRDKHEGMWDPLPES